MVSTQNRIRFILAIVAGVLIAPQLIAPLLPGSLSAQETATTAASETATEENDSETETRWTELFDGESFEGWEETRFGGEGKVAIDDGAIRMNLGVNMTGVTCIRKDLPTVDYEVEVVAKRTKGLDFFASITFPFKDTHCSFVPGGWSGGVTGLSNIDDQDASSNDTTCFVHLKDDIWYTFRVRVQTERIRCWVDDEQVIDQKIDKELISIRPEMTPTKPLGISAWQSESHIRRVRIRNLTEAEVAETAIEKVPTAEHSGEPQTTTQEKAPRQTD